MRMVCICTGLGMNPEGFFPKTFGRGYELSKELSPLEGMRDDFTVFSHMDHPGIFTKHSAMNSIFSGVDAAHAVPGENVSVDQAAQHVGLQTRFPSVHISLAGSQGSSWSSSGIKVREEGDPFALFQRLFVNDSDAGGGFKHGAHLDCKRPDGRQTPLNNFFTTMLQNFGVEMDRFNNATGNLNQLKA